MSTQQFSRDDLTSFNASDDTSAQADSKLQAIKAVLASGSGTATSSRYPTGSTSVYNTNNIDKALIDGLPLVDRYRNGSNDSAYAEATDGEKAILWALETKARAAAGVSTQTNSATLTPTQRLSMQNNMLATGQWQPSDGYYFQTPNGLAYDPTGEARAKLAEVQQPATSWEWLRDNGYDYTEGGTVYGKKVSGPNGGYNTGWTDDPAKKGDYQKQLEAVYSEINPTYVQPAQTSQVGTNYNLERADKILAQAGIDDSEQRTLIDVFIKIEKGESLTPSLLAPDQPPLTATGQGTVGEEAKPLGTTTSSATYSNRQDANPPVAFLRDDTEAQVEYKAQAIREALGDSPIRIDKKLTSNVDRAFIGPNQNWNSRRVSDEEKAIAWALETKAKVAAGMPTQSQGSALTPTQRLSMQNNLIATGQWKPSDGYYFTTPNGLAFDPTGLTADNRITNPEKYMLDPRAPGETGPYGIPDKDGYVRNPETTKNWEWLRDNGYDYTEGGTVYGKKVSGPNGGYNTGWTDDPALKGDYQLEKEAAWSAAGVRYVQQQQAAPTNLNPDLEAANLILAQAGLDENEQKSLTAKFLSIEGGGSTPSLLAPDKPPLTAIGQNTAEEDGSTVVSSDGTEQKDTLVAGEATSNSSSESKVLSGTSTAQTTSTELKTSESATSAGAASNATSQTQTNEEVSLVNASPGSTSASSGRPSSNNPPIPFLRDDSEVEVEYKAQAVREAIGKSSFKIDKKLLQHVDKEVGYKNNWNSRRVSDEEKAIAWALQTVAKPPQEKPSLVRSNLGVNVSQSLNAKLNLQKNMIANGEWKPSDGYYFKTLDGDIAFDPTGMAANNRFTNPENYMPDPRAPGESGPYGFPDKQGYVKIPEKQTHNWKWLRDNGYDYTVDNALYGEKVRGPKGGYNTGWTNDPAKKGDAQLAKEARMEAIMSTPGVKIVQKANASNMAFGLTPPKSDLEKAKLILAQAGLDENEQKALITKFLSIENSGSLTPRLVAQDRLTSLVANGNLTEAQKSRIAAAINNEKFIAANRIPPPVNGLRTKSNYYSPIMTNYRSKSTNIDSAL
jgi:hypothetical protein